MALSSTFTFTNFSSVLTGTPDVAWTNPSNAQSSDGIYATGVLTNDLAGQQYTQYLHCVRQNSSPTIPENCRIVGIKLYVERNGTVVSRNGIKDKTIQLINSSGTRKGTNKATAIVWPTGDTVATYGGDTDMWGFNRQDLTPAVVNHVAFGVAIQAQLSGALFSGNFTASVDYVYMTIYYRHKHQLLMGVT